MYETMELAEIRNKGPLLTAKTQTEPPSWFPLLEHLLDLAVAFADRRACENMLGRSHQNDLLG
jgi:hypothetical protein